MNSATFLSSLAILAFTASLAHAAPYTITGLGTTLGASYCVGTAMNEGGQVAGNCSFGASNRAFLHTSGGFVDIAAPAGYTSTYAYGLNNAGLVVGTLERHGSAPEALLWDGTTTYGLGRQLSQAIAINDSGTLGGLGANPGTFAYAGGTVNIVSPPGTVSVYDINETGQMTGLTGGNNSNTHAYRYDGSTVQDLGTFGGAMSQALNINNLGQVAGFAATSNGDFHAFLWDSLLTDLGTLGGNQSIAFGLNDFGDVVGNSRIADGSAHAFIWQSGIGMQDLNSLIESGTDWYLENAMAINNTGTIMGVGLHNGRTETFLLTPSAPQTVPEPGTLALVAASAALLLRASSRNARTRDAN